MGYDEAWFLGAQVLARVVFVTSDASLGGGGGAQQKYFMTRTDYNEVGPGGIGDFGL
jgi:actin-related protein 9